MNIAKAYRILRDADDTTDEEVIDRAIETLPSESTWHLLKENKYSEVIHPDMAGRLLQNQPEDRRQEFVEAVIQGEVSRSYVRAVLSNLSKRFFSYKPARSGASGGLTIDYNQLSSGELRELLGLVTDEVFRAIIRSDSVSQVVRTGAIEVVEDRLTHEMVADEFKAIGTHLNPLTSTVTGPRVHAGLKVLASALNWSSDEVSERLTRIVKSNSVGRAGELILLANHPEADIDQYDLQDRDLIVRILAGVDFQTSSLVALLNDDRERQVVRALVQYCRDRERLDEPEIRQACLREALKLGRINLFKDVLGDKGLSESSATDQLQELLDSDPIRVNPELYYQLREAGASLKEGGAPLLKAAFQAADDCDSVQNIVAPDLTAEEDQLTKKQREQCYRVLLQLDNRKAIEAVLESAETGPPPTLLKQIPPEHEYFELFAPFMSGRRRRAGEVQRPKKTVES